MSAAEVHSCFYESGHRIIKCLQELKRKFGCLKRISCLSRVNKKFETIYRGTIDQIIEQMQDERGEFVVVINQKYF